MSLADPPGLTLSPMAESVVITPLTSEGPVPPKVSMPLRTMILPTGWLICTPTRHRRG